MRKPAVGIFSAFIIPVRLNEMVVKLCYALGADVIYFEEEDLDMENETVNARIWTTEGFVREKTHIPYYVECGPAKFEHRQYFASRCTIIDDYTLSKEEVHDLLNQTEFAPCLIPTMHTFKPSNVLSFMELWKEIMVKPQKGARGERIITIKVIDDGRFRFVDINGDVKELSYDESVAELTELYSGSRVIVQPRMKFFNCEGRIMDFRINVQKNGKGEWETIFILARTSRGRIASNFSKGGYASLLNSTLEYDYGENSEIIKEYFNNIAAKIPPIIEEASKCNMLSLGIDVAIDRDTLQPYIIEVNYVPMVTFDKSAYIDVRSKYYKYLSDKVHNTLVEG